MFAKNTKQQEFNLNKICLRQLDWVSSHRFIMKFVYVDWKLFCLELTRYILILSANCLQCPPVFESCKLTVVTLRKAVRNINTRIKKRFKRNSPDHHCCEIHLCVLFKYQDTFVKDICVLLHLKLFSGWGISVSGSCSKHRVDQI